MFNSLVGTQTPAYQVWNFGGIATSANRLIALEDDCAPLQIIACGNATGQIFIYLPINPPAGKTITFRANNYGGGSIPTIEIYESTNRNSTILLKLCEAQTLTLCYAPELAPGGTAAVSMKSKWAVIAGPAIVGTNDGNNDRDSAGSIILGGNTNKLGGAKNSCIVGGENNNFGATVVGGFIGGGSSNTLQQTYSAILGGQFNSASGQFSSVSGGQFNGAAASYAVVGGGSYNYAYDSNAGVFSGSRNEASTYMSFIGGGEYNRIEGSSSHGIIGGGLRNRVDSVQGSILGGAWGITRGITGMQAIPACSAPIAGVLGVSQGGILVLGRQTTDATATVLTSDASPAATNNQIVLPNNAAYHFKASIISTVTGGGDTAAWTIEGVVKRGSDAGTAALVGTPSVNLVARDTGAATWTIAVTADTTNGGISFTFTGQTDTTIRTVCKVETTEVTY